MIRYDLPVLIGRKCTETGPEIKCHDTGIVLAVHLEIVEKTSKWREERKPYIIPEGTKALLRVKKPDGTAVNTDRGISIEGKGTVICEDVEQVYTAAGTCLAEIVLYDAAGKRLTSADFTYEVTPECVRCTDTPSADYFDILSAEIAAANEAARTANEAADKAIDLSVNPPKLSEVGTWLVWDADACGYVDTGVNGKGAKGDPGVVKFVVVNELPETDTENAIYLVPVTEGAEDNLFDEYIWVDGKWEKIGSAAVAVDLTDYVKNTDYASTTKAGVVKVYANNGVGIDATGMLSLTSAANTHIDGKNQKTAITPKNLDYAVKVGMTTNTEEWTEEEKQAARDLLGAASTKFATASTAGLVRCGEGLYMASSNGKINLAEPTEAQILARTTAGRAITPSKLDYAVKTSICDNKYQMTDEEKAAAQAWLGITNGDEVAY